MLATRWFGLLAVLAFCYSPVYGQDINLRYTWMLPKTVIDASVVYTFDGCTGTVAKIKIAPTLVARTIPDPLVGQLSIDTKNLQSFWQDRSISVQTYANSRILSSVGSSPSSQITQIVGNILTGVTKVAGLALGLPGAAFNKSTDAAPAPLCADAKTEDTAPWILGRIDDLKKKISAAQGRLIAGEAEAGQKQDTAAITAAQSQITTLQEKLTVTLKATIDPGITDIVPDPDELQPTLPEPKKDSQVDESGLIASLCPTRKLITKAKWFSNTDALFETTEMRDGRPVERPGCAALPRLMTNIYLDFLHGHSTMFDSSHKGSYGQTMVDHAQTANVQYRDVAYIPVLVWRGSRTAPLVKNDDPDVPLHNSFPLAQPQTMVFGQFGVTQTLPVATENAFKSLVWEVSFQEDGQMTKATFSSKAWGQELTSLFSNTAASANTITSSVTSSSSTQAAMLQGQSDLIYQTQRLHTCMTTPADCPSK